MKLKEFVVEVLKNGKWIYRSDHKNLLSAEANFEAVYKIVSARILQNGIVIKESTRYK
jgi:hypothetical protein